MIALWSGLGTLFYCRFLWRWSLGNGIESPELRGVVNAILFSGMCFLLISLFWVCFAIIKCLMMKFTVGASRLAVYSGSSSHGMFMKKFLRNIFVYNQKISEYFTIAFKWASQSDARFRWCRKNILKQIKYLKLAIFCIRCFKTVNVGVNLHFRRDLKNILF